MKNKNRILFTCLALSPQILTSELKPASQQIIINGQWRWINNCVGMLLLQFVVIADKLRGCQGVVTHIICVLSLGSVATPTTTANVDKEQAGACGLPVKQFSCDITHQLIGQS